MYAEAVGWLQGYARVARAWPALLTAAVLAATLLPVAALLTGGPFAAIDTGAGGATIELALRTDSDGRSAPVRLPDRIDAGADDRVVAAHYTAEFHVGAGPHDLALYLPGLLGAARVALNGQVLSDALIRPLPPRPRGLAQLRLVDLPEALLRRGTNRIDLDLAARGSASLSPLHVGARMAMHGLHDRKAFAMVVGPALVAAVVGCLGLAMLALSARRGFDRHHVYFGLGALLWALHSTWAASPPLTAPHAAVWQTSFDVALVVMLVLFCVQFVERLTPRLEGTLLAIGVTAPALLYTAAAVSRFEPAATLLRVVLVLLAGGALAIVAQHAWRRRSVDAALLAAGVLVGGGFVLRDWIAFHRGDDNLPVALTPYAGLAFVVLASWILIDRFVRAATAIEATNRQLEARVSRRESELAASDARLASLEREQSAADERQRLLRSLHDGVGARLFVSIERLRRDELDRAGVERELRSCLTDMRLAADTLEPGITEIGDALGNLLFRWDGVLRGAGVMPTWHINLPPEGWRIAPASALALLRVVQEALTNVLRHAHASRVSVSVVADGPTLALRVEDDGRGIDSAAPQRGHGIAGMYTRAEGLGGQLRVHAAPGGGTCVELHIVAPLPAADV